MPPHKTHPPTHTPTICVYCICMFVYGYFAMRNVTLSDREYDKHNDTKCAMNALPIFNLHMRFTVRLLEWSHYGIHFGSRDQTVLPINTTLISYMLCIVDKIRQIISRANRDQNIPNSATEERVVRMVIVCECNTPQPNSAQGFPTRADSNHSMECVDCIARIRVARWPSSINNVHSCVRA